MMHSVEFISNARITNEELAKVVKRACSDLLEDYTVKDNQLYKKVENGLDDGYKLEKVPNNTVSPYYFERIKAAKAVANNINMVLGI